MLYKLAEQIDGRARPRARSPTASARRSSGGSRPGDAQLLIEEQLRPLGVVAPAAGEDVELGKVDPLLALKFRAAVVPDRAVRALTTIFRPLFLPPVILAAVLAMLGLDGWLFFVHGVSQSLRHTLYQPLLMLMLIGGVVLATAWHEIGHATATRYGGAEPGVMGVGIYIVWPAFYTDITDAYRLGKWGRLRTDVGGMYFNAIFALLIAAAAYAADLFEPLLLLVVLQNFAILQQSLPFLRLDGYYILSDLTGVPDIFLRIRSVLSSLIPGRAPDERVTALKGWVRIVVSGYVVLVVALLRRDDPRPRHQPPAHGRHRLRLRRPPLRGRSAPRSAAAAPSPAVLDVVQTALPRPPGRRPRLHRRPRRRPHRRPAPCAGPRARRRARSRSPWPLPPASPSPRSAGGPTASTAPSSPVSAAP